VPVKRVDLIAKVIAKLPGKVEWTHIGTGPESARVEAVTSSYDADHTVRFMGRLKNSEVLSYFKNECIDLFVNLSESEGVPVSIMEALSYGVPCVATDVGGTAEIVNKENGEVVAVGSNAKECSLAVRRVMNNVLARESARKAAALMCSAEKNYTEFCKILTGVCGKKKGKYDV
jgi:glycosyltransferase involved in cell wall biosynthesis